MTLFARPPCAALLSSLLLLGSASCRSGQTNPPPSEPAPAPAPAPAPEPEPAPTAPAEPPAEATETAAAPDLDSILQGQHRSAENRARDVYRHPRETLAFFGVEPTSTVVELWPGNGWYTEILAPYLRDQGRLIVTGFDPQGPAQYYGTRISKDMQDRFARQPELFGKVSTVTVPINVQLDSKGGVKSLKVLPFELAEPGTVDVVLTFRNSHGWYENGAQDTVYGAAFRALKPGGVFGVVQHRAADGANPEKTAPHGYLPEATVIAAAQKVGFQLAEKSEINANPKDTRDYEAGVWALPPALRNGEKDRDRYLAIGESDRMTLKFVKPANAPTTGAPSPASAATAPAKR